MDEILNPKMRKTEICEHEEHIIKLKDGRELILRFAISNLNRKVLIRLACIRHHNRKNTIFERYMDVCYKVEMMEDMEYKTLGDLEQIDD